MKPTVIYKKSPFNRIKVGHPAFIHPINHPNHLEDHAVSNTTFVNTSKVINIYQSGFETQNTIYKEQAE